MRIEHKKILKDIVQITTSDERFYYKESKDKYYPSSTWISSYVPSKELAIWMAKKGWDEAELIKQEAGARGSRVHKGCEILACGGEVNHNDKLSDGEGNIEEITADEYEAIISFKAWFNDTKKKVGKIEVLKTEHTVFNEKENYAGTLDLMIKIGDNIWLIDFKTSKYIHLSHIVQLSSYKHADGHFEEGIDKVKLKLGILQLGYKPNKCKYKFTEIEDKYEGFLHAKYFWNEANKNISPKQIELPLKIKLGE